MREWLDGQVAGGLVAWDAASDRYELAPEAAMALADDDSPAFVARAMNAFGSLFIDMPKIAEAFRGDGALSWGDHHPCLFSGTEWFFRTGYRAELPELDRRPRRRRRQARTPARPSPTSAAATARRSSCSPKPSRRRTSPASTSTPRRSTPPGSGPTEAGVSDAAAFEVADAKGYDGTFDLICFFDCLHDMGDPVGIARYALDHLAEDGTVLLVEPFALDGRADNIAGNPMAALLYTASSSICTPNSLSQEVGLGLGAQAGEGRLREVFEQAGYTRFRRAAETPLNLILEAKR